MQRVIHNPILLGVLAASLACSAQAYGIYKTVGADGKVTYSDHPPADQDGRAEAIGKNAAPEPASRPAVARAAAPAKNAAVLAVPATQPAAPANAAAALEGAIVGVLSIEDIVRQTEALCTKALPTAYGKYSGAASQWRQRNRVVVMQARHAIAQGFNTSNGADAEQRIENAVRARNQGMFQPIAQAGTAEMRRWCDDSVEDIQAGSMDFAGKPKLTESLRGYR